MSAGGRLPFRLRHIGAAGIAAIAVTRVVVFFAPRLVFDVDPAFDPQPLAGLGPAGSLWLDAALLLACAVALLGETLAGRRLDPVLLVLGLIPVPVAAWHGWHDAGDLWRGASWCAAAIAGVTAAHLARDAVVRAMLAAVLIAILAPLLARGAANVTYEHEDNIRRFEQQKESLFRDKGWEAGSSYALIFERRLRQRQPIGWFVTTNVYASFMAFGLIAGAGLAIACGRARLPSGWTGLAALLAVGCGAGLLMTGSKGGILLGLAGLGLLLVPLIWRAAAPLARRLGPPAAAASIVVALAAVAVRGTLLPESFLGDRSLLFRWHYTVSAARILGEHPLLGVGPDGFQRAYVRHRLPRNPEEVASAHATVWDWCATLGVSGAAWVGLILVLLWRAGRAGGREPPADGDEEPATLPTPLSMILAPLLGLTLALAVEGHAIGAVEWVVRVLGVAGFVFVAMTLAPILLRGDTLTTAWTLTVGVVIVLMHTQIEMTGTQPGAAVWVMVMLGVAAARSSSRPPRGRVVGSITACLPAALGVAVIVLGAVPATRQEIVLRRAAQVLAPLAGAEVTPVEVASRRRRAAALLREADARMPTARWPQIVAAEQLERAARGAPPEIAEPLLREALVMTQSHVDAGDRGPASALAVFIHRQLAQRTGDQAHGRAVIELLRLAVEADPNGLLARKRLADALWDAGDLEAAREAYRRTLEIDDDFELDPLKRLAPADRTEIERRLR